MSQRHSGERFLPGTHDARSPVRHSAHVRNEDAPRFFQGKSAHSSTLTTLSRSDAHSPRPFENAQRFVAAFHALRAFPCGVRQRARASGMATRRHVRRPDSRRAMR